jgi:hypothetical protein
MYNTTVRHFQGRTSTRFIDDHLLTMGLIAFPETSVNNSQQKSEDLMYTAAEALKLANHIQCLFCSSI